MAVGVEQVDGVKEVAGAQNHRDRRTVDRRHVCGDETDRDADQHARPLLHVPQRSVVQQEVTDQYVVGGVGLNFHPREVRPDRRDETVAERMRRHPNQHDAVLECVGCNAMVDDVGNREPRDGAAGSAEMHGHAAEFIDRNLDAADADAGDTVGVEVQAERRMMRIGVDQGQK